MTGHRHSGKRQCGAQKLAGDLPQSQISGKQARSIKYQTTISRMPLARENDESGF
jgi:hypothetical protein